MRMRPLLCVATLTTSLLLLPLPARGQSVLERTPNLSGGWTGQSGTAYFNFLHRFYLIDIADGQDRILNTPTFLLGYGLTDLFLAGLHYSSSSRTAPDHPHELEALLRFSPLQPGGPLPFELSLTGAYNTASGSVDGEVAGGFPLGIATLMGSLRGFSDAFGSGDSRAAVGGGVRVQLRPSVALAGDVVTPLSRRDDEVIGWGAGLQLAIPFTPHTFSLHATNTTTSTLQGSSRGLAKVAPGQGGTRWGFEFTIPITLSRYFGSGAASGDVTVTADTVRVAIRDFDFEIERLVVRPGTTVVWVNEGDVPHTSSSDTDIWSSPLLAPGESYSRVFGEPGEFPYYCEPHAFMRATIVVQPGG